MLLLTLHAHTMKSCNVTQLLHHLDYQMWSSLPDEQRLQNLILLLSFQEPKKKMKLFSSEKRKSYTITCEKNRCCDLLILTATGDYHVLFNNYRHMTMFWNFFAICHKQILIVSNVTRNNRVKVLTASHIDSILTDIIWIVSPCLFHYCHRYILYDTKALEINLKN